MNIKILDIKISTLQKRNCMLFLLSIQGGKIKHGSDVLRLTVVD